MEHLHVQAEVLVLVTKNWDWKEVDEIDGGKSTTMWRLILLLD